LKEQLESVFNLITLASKKGKYHAVVIDLNPELKNKLRELGYKLEENTRIGEFTKISWEGEGGA
jgi:hypothetical protein